MNTLFTRKTLSKSITTIFSVLMVVVFMAMSVSPAAAQGQVPTQIGTPLVFDATNPAPAEMPSEYAAAKVAQVTLYVTADGKAAEAGATDYYDMTVENAYADMTKAYTAATVTFLDGAPEGVQMKNVAATVVAAPEWCAIVMLIASKVGITQEQFVSAAPMCESVVVPSMFEAPAPAADAPEAEAPEANAAPAGTNTARNPVAGTQFKPFDGMIVTATGSGAIARFESTKPWIVPATTSADLGGKKYLGGETVPAGYGTFFDVDRWAEIVPADGSAPAANANEDAPTTALPTAACTTTDLASLEVVDTATVTDAQNGQLELTFNAGSFTVYCGDLDYNGVKYHVNDTITVAAGDKATYWLASEFKPAK